MSNFRIACCQITWKDVPEEQMLAEIQQAGYEGVPAGPRKGLTTQQVLDHLAKFDLKPVPSYLGANFWLKEAEAPALERAERMAVFAREAGCTELFVASGGFANYVTARGLNRSQTAGNVLPEDGMTDEEYDQCAATLNRVGEITLKEGVRSCVHNHGGTPLETREEIDRLFSLVDRELVFMGPDTGHLALGGVDVVEFFRDYADSIKTVHLKDVDLPVLEEGRAQGWEYWTFKEKGVWTELGQGFLDFPAMLEILKAVDYDGWLVVETDVTQLPTAEESAVVSRNYLRSLGL